MMILNHPQWVRTHKFQIHRRPSSVSGEVAPPNPHRPPRSGSCGVVSMKRLKSSLRRRISLKVMTPELVEVLMLSEEHELCEWNCFWVEYVLCSCLKSSKVTGKRKQQECRLHGLSSTSKFVKARIAICGCGCGCGCRYRYFFCCRYIFCMAHEEVARRYEIFLFYFG
ncbi:uncharacterized protein LOC132311314 isoform X1 [Cornus florida]|uniref:uncharacterized protein LOC132311314 isoform X1 n=1 Tax=Cornus florida TaxID=4283 RepID=UPI0028A10884|nr:uncharacterized protein LOC132311314 isoform X1 [Cornus florida]